MAEARTATFVKDVSDQFAGKAFLYRLSPGHNGREYVVSSAAIVPGMGAETYIFASDPTGTITDWLELDGSQKGIFDPEEAIRNAGYTIVQGEK